ncbi:hypothetical protein [Pseudomonas sp. PLMAX]|uniref:hypothetical protein n=1 Tax=Pseudomonas sp. PLMAX TaxID=2201998 RepID=UPI0038B837B3
MRGQIALVALLVIPVVAAEAGEITWSVANGFQQFSKDEDFQKIKQAWKPGMTAEDFLSTQNAASLRELLPIDRTWWEREKGVYNNKGLFDPTHDILLTYKGATAGASCQWSINGASVGAATSCDKPATAINVDEKKPFTLAVSVDGGPAQTLPEKQQIETRLIVAVGDSFASGEGNPDHAAITNTLPEKGSKRENKTSVESLSWAFAPNMSNRRFTQSADWWDTTCHRSFLSWQSLYALRQAVDNEHMVVRYASFSCSGAEVYDGFFRAQIDPPVNLGDGRVRKSSERDGGNILTREASREDKGPQTWAFVKDTSTKTSLSKSQLNATIALLCEGQTSKGASTPRKTQKQGLRDGSPYYGDFEYDRCDGKTRKPDELLSSFGGNDFGFSGVVMWGLIPSTPVGFKWDPRTWFAGQGLHFLRGFKVVDPKKAGAKANDEMSDVYSELNWAFTDVLGVKPAAIKELVYPNPFPQKLSEVCSARMTQGNESLSEYSKKKGGKLFKNFIYRVEDKDAQKIYSEFVEPLQSAQRNAITEYGWTRIESQAGFVSPAGDRTICAVAIDCDNRKGSCDLADLPGWRVPKYDIHPSLHPIKNVTEWEAYAPKRMRGLRMSNDAVLTQARFKDGLIQEDWMSGSVHPVAQVHAGIADSISDKANIASK